MKSARIVASMLLGGSLLLAGCSSDSGGGSDTSSPSAAPESTVNETPMTEQDKALIDRIVAKVYTDEVRKDFPGLWVGVWDEQRGAYTAAFGEAMVGGDAAAVDDVFRIGSVTKTFTAAVVLQLVDQGAFSLEDTITEAAPQVAQANPKVADRTVQQLLAMASGIPDYLNVPDGVVADISKDPARVWTSQELVDAGVAGGLKPAGERGYSTTNYVLLQQIAEESEGKPLRDIIAERITGPLGLSTAALPPDDDTALPDPGTGGYLNPGCVAEVQADGGTATEGQDVTDWNASYGQGGGGMYATLADLGRWGGSLFGNSLLTESTAAKRLDAEPLPEGIGYGLGIIDYGDGFLGHSGEAIGWQAQVTHNPDSAVTFALGTNACNGADPTIFDKIRQRVGVALAKAPAATAAAAQSSTTPSATG